MKRYLLSVIMLFLSALCLNSCMPKAPKDLAKEEADSTDVPFVPITTTIEKELTYNQYTLADTYPYKDMLADTYPYKDTVRIFQWDKIRSYLILIDSIQAKPALWGILQNHKDETDIPPLVQNYRKDEYDAVTDEFGVEQYQGTPLYALNDSTTPVRYGLDGSLVKIGKGGGKRFIRAKAAYFDGEWLIPKKYINFIEDTVVFEKVIFVDRTNQNICTLEKSGDKWLVRSMNPATTGLHHPPVMRATPLGIFVIQEKKTKMIYLTDDGSRVGGFAPYANRFCNGGYIHGVPVNMPHTEMVEFSPTLGTTPRSHMCVRNATSHAKFIFNWAPVEGSLVVVFD